MRRGLLVVTTGLGIVLGSKADAAFGAPQEESSEQPGLAQAAPAKPARKGLWLTSEDGMIDVRFIGTLMIDFAFQNADSDIEELIDEDVTNAGKPRRARLGAQGRLYDAVDFKLEYDFALEPNEPTDLFLGFDELPVGYLRVGYMKDPIGLEKLTSPKHTTFLENGLPATVDRTRKMGFDLSDEIPAGNATWAAGLFTPTDAQGSVIDGDAVAFVGRLTSAPILAREGRELLHVGVAYQWQDSPNDAWRLRRRPENFLAPFLIDTGLLPSESWQVAAVEGAWVHDSVSLQGEAFWARADVSAAPDPDFNGAYLFASWFATGECRPYDRQHAIFKQVKPKHNFGKGGKGALELAARYSWFDATDDGIDGGVMHQVTLGANWYLNPNSRITLNTLLGELDREGVDGTYRAVLLRFQVDF